MRATRQRPLTHSIADLAGRYESPALGLVTFTVQDGALRYRWGVLEGPVEVFDAARDQLRIEFAGSGSVVGFRFDGPGPARSLELTGETFVLR